MSPTVVLRFTFFLYLLVSVAGCSHIPFFGKGDDAKEEEETSEQLLYRSAQASVRAGNYAEGITKLEKLEAHFPFGRYAEQAQLELIYARYMSYAPEAARSAADRFIRLHPQHPNVDYAYYMKGLASYSKDRGFADRFQSSEISRRDASSARQAFADFSELISRYPESQYAGDAQQRMIYLRNILAEAEVNVAQFYMGRRAYVAAANRAREVVENYSQSTSVADALAILIEANWKLGLKDAANDALRVLAANYPRYPAFDDKGNFVFAETINNRDRSWLNLMTLGLVDRPDVPPPIQIQYPQNAPRPTPAAQPATPQTEKDRRPWYRRLLSSTST
jgi:outer membrane protein assembly factor BamD